MADRLSRVTVHSATIATLLHSVAAGGAPCDGLIFGETTQTVTQHLSDNDDAVTETVWRAGITSLLCCASTCSFYDAAGQIDEAQLASLCGQHPDRLLGVLSYRPATLLRPSMREAAVAQALLQRQLGRAAAAAAAGASGGAVGGGGGGEQAVLLLLVTSGTDHNNATVTWQYRCLQARLAGGTGELLLEPVELSTANLGHHTGQRAYEQLAASSSHAAGGGDGGGLWGPEAVAHAPELAVLAEGARAQVDGMRRYCEGLLGGLQELCGQATAGEAAVQELRRRRDALLGQLAAQTG